MKSKWQRISALFVILIFGFLVFGMLFLSPTFEKSVIAQTVPTPTPVVSPSPEFNQAETIAKLKEQIKGKENEPAEKVFKNIQMMKGTPAGRLLAIMEFGYARSLGVNCTHCHVPEKFESEEKSTKQIARDMSAMVKTINVDLLKNIKNLKSESPIINCTTCHRGQTKPALNLPMPKS
jgi:hypothetical protein